MHFSSEKLKESDNSAEAVANWGIILKKYDALHGIRAV
jgi:hypothetical protein